VASFKASAMILLDDGTNFVDGRTPLGLFSQRTISTGTGLLEAFGETTAQDLM